MDLNLKLKPRPFWIWGVVCEAAAKGILHICVVMYEWSF